MQSFEDGFHSILAAIPLISKDIVPLLQAHNRVLRSQIKSRRDHPSVDISAMDGYALSGAHKTYVLKGEIRAGVKTLQRISDGEAVRIFTGAPIPVGADRVMIQENAVPSPPQLTGKIPEIGAHIRRKASDFDKLHQVQHFQKLTPEKIALIAAMGHNQVSVSSAPHVAILPTGSELVEPGEKFDKFDVISSNPYGLSALIDSESGIPELLPIQSDNLTNISTTLQKLNHDIIVTSGGASIGKYDYVHDAAVAAGFSIQIHKIALRPGKPIIFGKRDRQIFLGLPGNPVSAMVTAHIFLRSIIKKMQGLDVGLPQTEPGELLSGIAANGDRTHFMRARRCLSQGRYQIQVYQNQDSASLSRLDEANCYVVRPPFDAAKEAKDIVFAMPI